MKELVCCLFGAFFRCLSGRTEENLYRQQLAFRIVAPPPLVLMVGPPLYSARSQLVLSADQNLPPIHSLCLYIRTVTKRLPC
jgi:hypothetical protein